MHIELYGAVFNGVYAMTAVEGETRGELITVDFFSCCEAFVAVFFCSFNLFLKYVKVFDSKERETMMKARTREEKSSLYSVPFRCSNFIASRRAMLPPCLSLFLGFEFCVKLKQCLN